MSISPFAARPGSPAQEGRRARLVVLLVALGIAASLLAYGISPGVRHAVGHAAHSVGRVLDRDRTQHKAAPQRSIPPAGSRSSSTPTAPPAKPQR